MNTTKYIRYGLTAVLFLNVSCTTKTIVSSRLKESAESPAKSTKAIEGIPYFLPTSAIEVSLESEKTDKGEHKELKLTTDTRYLPDPKSGYLLESLIDDTYSLNHQFKIEDGMLTLVTTEDESKIDEIIADLVTTAANIFTFGATGGIPQSLQGDPKLPTPSEITDLYKMIAPGAHTFVFGKEEEGVSKIPGTQEILQVKVVPEDLYGDIEVASTGTNATEVAEYSGIYTRMLKPAKAEIRLEVRLKPFYRLRIQKSKSAIEKNTRDKAAATETETATKDKLKKLEAQSQRDEDAIKKTKEELAKISDNIKKLDEAIQELNKSIKENTDWEADTNEDTAHRIATHTAILLIPDESVIVKVPVKKSRLGLSKNHLALKSGILTEYKTEKPSEALEFFKIPLNISEKLVELPTKILKLKVDYATKEKELATAEKDLKDKLSELNALPEAPSNHALEVQALEQQKEIIELKRDITILEREIWEATQANGYQ